MIPKRFCSCDPSCSIFGFGTLGMEVARSKNGIFISQRKYVLDVLEETRMSGCELSDTPMEQNHKLGDRIEGVPVEVGRYQFMHLPYEEHLEAVY